MKKYLKILSLLLLSIFLTCTYAKSQVVTWQKILNNNYGYLQKAHETPDKGFITVGSDYIGPLTRIYLHKFNFKGDSLWTQIIGTSSNGNDGFWVENTFDNGFIISGDAESDGYILKTNYWGHIEWDNSFGGSDLDQAYCIKQTADSGYIIVTRTTSFSNYNNILIVKTDGKGNIQWQRPYLANNNQIGKEIIVLENAYCVIGYAFNDIYFMKVDINGDTLFTKRYGSIYSEAGFSIQQTADKGFIIGGIAYNSMNISNSIILKTDSFGNVQWQRTYTAKFNELLFSVRNVQDRGYIFCGTTDSVEGDLERGFIRIIDFKGNVLKEKFYRALPYYTEIRSVENTNDGGFILCGVTQRVSGGVPKMYIAKTDSVGEISPVGISNYSFQIPASIKLYQNYPNPFNPTTQIKFDINEKMNVLISIFDISGKKIVELINKSLFAGSYEISFKPEDYSLASGIYIYKLITPYSAMSEKMLFLK